MNTLFYILLNSLLLQCAQCDCLSAFFIHIVCIIHINHCEQTDENSGCMPQMYQYISKYKVLTEGYGFKSYPKYNLLLHISLSHFKKWTWCTHFMSGRINTCALFSVHWNVCGPVNKYAREHLACIAETRYKVASIL